MQEKEFSLKDMLCYILREWRKIIVFALAVAVLFGTFVAITRGIDMKDPKKTERWEAEHEVARNAYWAPIYEIDRKILENERLAAEAKAEIEKLTDKKAEHEAQITDAQAKIAYYEALIEDYKAGIEQLRLERTNVSDHLEHRRQHNESSLLMKIDPYQVNVYESYLRVDSGYVILPENSYQNPDPTAELRQTYRLLINNAEFFTKMIAELGLNTEVSYLTEVVTVSDYGSHSLHVHVLSDSKDWAKKVGDYICSALLSKHSEVVASIKDHTLTQYNTLEYSTVDLSICTKQNALLNEVSDYETALREMNTAILQTEVDIREMDTEIRLSRQSIKEAEHAIAALPLEKQALEQKNADHLNANVKLRADKLALQEKPEPQYGGYTVTGIAITSAKYAVLAGVVTAIVLAMYFAVIACLNEKVQSSDQLCQVLNVEFFGHWPQLKKRRFGFVDRWIVRLAGSTTKNMTAEIATELVLANVKLACAPKAKILICGGAEKETVKAVAEAVKTILPEAQILSGGTLSDDPNVVRGLHECDAVILVEQLDRSDLSAAAALKERAVALNKDVLGAVLSQ